MITLSTCFYVLNKAKFNPTVYQQWMQNFFSLTNNFYLVIYTDAESLPYLGTINSPNIKIIEKSLSSFYNYKYKQFWQTNHQLNHYLNKITCWELHMLWAEKIAFVKETIDNQYFNTDLYGWCDIGYFRNRPNDLSTHGLSWPNNQTIFNTFDSTKILYGCVSFNTKYIQSIVTDKLIPDINPSENHIAGGFFLLHKSMILWWFTEFDSTLLLYFQNNRLVKDDQIILTHCIFKNLQRFSLAQERNPRFDHWFMFQRLLT
jgi:hypothetical protein